MEQNGIATSPNELLKRVTSRTTLHIGRVPPKTLAEFKEWASEEFDGDWGFALKHLFDVYKGSLPPPESQVTLAIEELAARMDAVEGKSEQSEEKTITLGNGDRIEKRS